MERNIARKTDREGVGQRERKRRRERGGEGERHRRGGGCRRTVGRGLNPGTSIFFHLARKLLHTGRTS